MIGRILTLLALSCVVAVAQVKIERGDNLPAFPDPVGRAGMAAAAVRLADGSQGLLVVGGANFPGRAPWDGGEKVFHADIVLLSKIDGAWTWTKVGDLPEPVAYAAFGPCKEGLVIAGGVNAEGHLAAVRVITPEGRVSSRRPLPTTLAYAACATDGDRLVVIGGQSTPTATSAEPFFGLLDLSEPDARWLAKPWLANGRILGTAGVLDGKLVLAGGCTLKSGPDGKPFRTYLSDTRVFKLDSDATDWESASVAGPQLPFPVVAACGPAVAIGERLILIGADDGSHYGKPPANHPGQRGDILVIDPDEGTVEIAGKIATGCVTTPAVQLGSDIVIVSGETKPGVRTAEMQVLRTTVSQGQGWVPTLSAALAAVVGAAALGWAIRRSRKTSGKAQP
jgi:hypothetical protein